MIHKLFSHLFVHLQFKSDSVSAMFSESEKESFRMMIQKKILMSNFSAIQNEPLFTDSYDSMQLTFAQNHFICVPHLKGVTQNESNFFRYVRIKMNRELLLF